MHGIGAEAHRTNYCFMSKVSLLISVVDPDPHRIKIRIRIVGISWIRNWIRINLQMTSQMYGIWAYLSNFSRVWAFIWNLGSGSGFASGWKNGSASLPNKNPDPHQGDQSNPEQHPDPKHCFSVAPGTLCSTCFLFTIRHGDHYVQEWGLWSERAARDDAGQAHQARKQIQVGWYLEGSCRTSHFCIDMYFLLSAELIFCGSLKCSEISNYMSRLEVLQTELDYSGFWCQIIGSISIVKSRI